MPQEINTQDEMLLLHALADGELDAATALALEARIAADPLLGAELERIMAIKGRVAQLDRPELDSDFEARIAALTGPPARLGSLAQWGRPPVFGGWPAIAASILVTAFIASSATYLFEAPRQGFSMEDAVAGSHRRSLLAASPVDITSSDRHTVKPWLDARLGISPPATDLAAQGYPLVGGRVDVVGTNTVPTLVYRHNEHLITVLAQPGSRADAAPSTEIAAGYNIVHWSAGGFTFWAVSDLEPSELEAFVAHYRGSG